MHAAKHAGTTASLLLLFWAQACGRSSLGRADSSATTQISSSVTGQGGSGQGGTGHGGAGQGGTGQGGTGPTGPGGSGGTGPGSGGVGGTGPGSGGGGAPPGVEACLNGIDDDGDGLVDCADADCGAGFTCTPPVPAGWKGPLALYEGSGSDAAPLCNSSGGYLALIADAFEGLSASSAMCPGCSCSTPQGVACAVFNPRFFYSNNQCLGNANMTTIGANFCSPFVFINDPVAVQWFNAPPAGGVCLPMAMGSPSVPPVSWAARARACGNPPQGGGCGGNACVPRPQGLFDTAICIVQDGDVACPSGGYSQRVVYYQSVSDSRSCSACGCGNPTGMTCTGTFEVWDDWTCTSNGTTLTSPGQCAALQPESTPMTGQFKASRSLKYTPGPAQGGSCPPIASNPTGSAKATQPLTICCTP
jgi:hypothetical protein